MSSPESTPYPPRPIGNLAAALAAAQAEMAGAKKDSANPFYKSKYADLASVWEACRAALSKNKLAVIQTTDCGDGNVTLVTTLAHESGEFVRGFYPIQPVKDRDPQALGSALTYARRYALAAIVGVAPEDDDGEAAMDRPGASARATQPQKGAAPPPAKPKTIDDVVASQAKPQAAKPEPLALTDLWESRPGTRMDVAIPVGQHMWNAWANDQLPDSSLAARGHKTWREVSDGSPNGFRHKMLLEAVAFAKANVNQTTDFHEKCACTLAVMEWKHTNARATSAKTEPTPEDYKHPATVGAPEGRLFGDGS